MLAKLKHWSDVQNEVESNDSIDQEKFHPVAQEVYIYLAQLLSCYKSKLTLYQARNINIGGLTLLRHMDFVVPPENEPDLAYLVIVGEDKNGSIFLVIRIDCNRHLIDQDFNPIHRIVLGTRTTPGLDKFLFIIPLKHRSGLFVCAEKHLALVIDIKNPRFELQSSYLGDSDIEAVHDPGHSRPDPLYTAWTRPLRRKEWWDESHKDVAYLCRQDGQIKLLSLTA